MGRSREWAGDDPQNCLSRVGTVGRVGDGCWGGSPLTHSHWEPAGVLLSELYENRMLLGENLGIGWEGSGGKGRGSSRTHPSPPDPIPEGHLPSAHQALQGHCHPRGPALPGEKRQGGITGEGASYAFTSSPL